MKKNFQLWSIRIIFTTGYTVFDYSGVTISSSTVVFLYINTPTVGSCCWARVRAYKRGFCHINWKGDEILLCLPSKFGLWFT